MQRRRRVLETSGSVLAGAVVAVCRSLGQRTVTPADSGGHDTTSTAHDVSNDLFKGETTVTSCPPT